MTGVLADLAAAPEHGVRPAGEFERRRRAERVQHPGRVRRRLVDRSLPREAGDDHRVDPPRQRGQLGGGTRGVHAAADDDQRPRRGAQQSGGLADAGRVGDGAERRGARRPVVHVEAASGPLRIEHVVGDDERDRAGAAAGRDAERGPHEVWQRLRIRDGQRRLRDRRQEADLVEALRRHALVPQRCPVRRELADQGDDGDRGVVTLHQAVGEFRRPGSHSDVADPRPAGQPGERVRGVRSRALVADQDVLESGLARDAVVECRGLPAWLAEHVRDPGGREQAGQHVPGVRHQRPPGPDSSSACQRTKSW